MLYGKRTSKPNPGVGIDWGCSLADGLLSLYAFNEGSGNPVDAVTGNKATVGSSCAWASSLNGPSLVSNGGSSNSLINCPYVPVTTSKGYTLFVRGKRLDTGAAGSILANWGTGSSDLVLLMYNNTYNGLGIYTNSTLYDVPPTLAQTSWHNLVYVVKPGASQPTLYVDGVQVGLSQVSLTGGGNNTAGLTFGTSSAGNTTSIQVDAAGQWNRALSATEVRALSANPWQLYQAPSYRFLPTTPTPAKTFVMPRRVSKPNPGVGIDWSNPLSQGLQGFYALNEGAGATAHDATGRRVDLTANGFGPSQGWSGGGLSLTVAGEWYGGTLPTALQYNFPITIGCGFINLGIDSTNGGGIFGCWYNNPIASPYDSWLVYKANNVLSFAYNANGIQKDVSTGVTLQNGVQYVVAVRFTPTGQEVFLNGVSVYTSSVTGNVLYGPNPTLSIGAPPNVYDQTNALIQWAGWWNRGLSAAEVNELTNPWAMFTPVAYPLSEASAVYSIGLQTILSTASTPNPSFTSAAGFPLQSIASTASVPAPALSGPTASFSLSTIASTASGPSPSLGSPTATLNRSTQRGK